MAHDFIEVSVWEWVTLSFMGHAYLTSGKQKSKSEEDEGAGIPLSPLTFVGRHLFEFCHLSVDLGSELNFVLLLIIFFIYFTF